MASSSSSSVEILSECTVQPHLKSTIKSLKLSISDLPMLSFQYIQKGVLLPSPPLSFSSKDLLSLLKLSLSHTLSHFPALAGRLHTDIDGHVHIICNDNGVDFFHAKANHLSKASILLSHDHDVPAVYRLFFQFDNTLSYAGHDKPLVAVQVTELNDAVFIGCTVNHAVVDGTSFWNFFNTFAEVARGEKISTAPDFNRNTLFDTTVVLKFPPGGPSATFSGDEPLREKFFHFSRESIMKLKLKANNTNKDTTSTSEISAFQSLCAQLWRSITRARNLNANKTTTLNMPMNCRHRVEPRMKPLYFGNAIQKNSTVATVGELLSNELNWAATRLHQNIIAHDNATIRKGVKEWENNPRVFQLGNSDGATVWIGSSHRFPMYENDFGWGRPLAVRSGRASKFDGKNSAFPGALGNGSIDLEVVLNPEIMACLEKDLEFMQYVS